MKQQSTLSKSDKISDAIHEQAHREDLDAFRQQRILHGHERWQAIIDAWQTVDDSACRCWVMYSANYLACTGGVRWAIDPVRAVWMNREAKDVDVTPLESLHFVLLTHNHSDHADKALWKRLKHAPIQWMVPSFMRNMFVEVTGIEDQRLRVMTPGQTVECGGVRILPFEGLHWGYHASDEASEPQRLGIDAMGYQLQWGDRTWLFPGDTRTYDASTLMSLRSPDVLFSHVWLGRGAAEAVKPPLLDAFVSFIETIGPKERVVLAHLYETSRPPSDCWTAYHAKLVAQKITEQFSILNPRLQVDWPLLGEVITL